jgi:Arc/MetJ-type ribon-helix-helix transcriptional regulator
MTQSRHRARGLRPAARSIVEHGQCSRAISGLQTKNQRAGILDVSLGTTLGGLHSAEVDPCCPSAASMPLESHRYTIHIPSTEMETGMAAEIHRLRDRASETEKITINVGYVDLGHIDLLVQEGFYSNRTDFIRTAIRNQLAAHGEEVRKSIVRHTLELGLRHYTRADLEAVEAAGEKLHIKVLGLATIAPDVTPSLAMATIESITVLGALHASKEVKSALADRIR